MATVRRVMIQLSDMPAGPRQLPNDVATALARAGALDVHEAHPDVLPGLFVASLPGGVDESMLLYELRRLPRVRDAALDEFQEPF